MADPRRKDKPAKIRGKAPSVKQARLLQEYDVDKDWLIENIRVKSDDQDSKKARLSFTDSKYEEWTLVHKTTGEKKVLKVPI